MIVDIKCPVSAYNLNFEDTVKQKQVPFYKLKDNKIEINKSHTWYYQISISIAYSKKKKTKSLFGLWLGENVPVKVEIIVKDDQFWINKMEPKLTKFYLKLHLTRVDRSSIYEKSDHSRPCIYTRS